MACANLQWFEMAVLPYPLGMLEEIVRWVRLVCGPSGCMPFSKKRHVAPFG